MYEHPTQYEIELYCRRYADNMVVRRIGNHINDCSDCARRVDEAVRALVRERYPKEHENVVPLSPNHHPA